MFKYTGLWAGLLGLLFIAFPATAEEEDTIPGWDGLVALEETGLHAVYVDPAADFSVFRRVAILDPDVAFRSNWLRDQNRSRSRNVRASDVERIKGDVADIFKNVFIERLEAAGYEVVNYAGEDVLVLLPAIVDLDVAAPDVRTSARQRTYTSSAGAATLVLEVFDSITGDLIGRAVDRRAARGVTGFQTVANRVTNRADARREFGVWADKLVEFLDEHYVEAAE